MKYWKNSNVVHDSPTCMTTDRPGSRPMVEVTDEQLAAMLLLYGSVRNCKICTIGLPKVRRRRKNCPRCGRDIAVSSWHHNRQDGKDCESAYKREDDEARRVKRDALMAEPVTVLALSERPRNCLRRAGIETLGDLTDRTADDLLVITNFGQKPLEEVEEQLYQRGLRLKSPDWSGPAEWLASLGKESS